MRVFGSFGSPTVVARDVSKTYRITKEGDEVGFSFRRNGKTVEALKPLSFAATAGEFVGLVGQNGSGKSTLLELISGSEVPTSGEVLVSARPTLLSVSAALQPHLDALDNVRLGLLAKGLSYEHVEEIKYDVATWAEIGDAIHRPLKTYSSGMAARLKFAIATAVDPNILLVDEALATGDAAFNQKAQERMQGFLDNAATVFLVSHNLATITKFSSRVLWLHNGELLADGPTSKVGKLYRAWSKYEGEADRVKAGKMLRRARLEYEPPKIVFDSEIADALDR